jgi:hypothetical protein
MTKLMSNSKNENKSTLWDRHINAPKNLEEVKSRFFKLVGSTVTDELREDLGEQQIASMDYKKEKKA